MIPNQSKQTADLGELEIQLYLTQLGWTVHKAHEGCSYDLIVDMGLGDDGRRILKTIQVKTNPRTSSRPGGDNNLESVSNGGKQRRNYWYYDAGIDFIASFRDGKPVFWERETYQKKSPSELKKSSNYEFPENTKISPYRMDAKEIPTVGNFVPATLSDFFG